MTLPSDPKLILIVDDTPTNVAVISGLLKDSFRTKVATSGAKALEIATGPEKPDLILLDVMMPDMDGFEVCRRLQSQSDTRNLHNFPLQRQAPSRGEGF
jgi:putative two-component system response regulator